MEAGGEIAVYTLLGIVIVLLIFFGALRFVDAARRGPRPHRGGRDTPGTKTSR